MLNCDEIYLAIETKLFNLGSLKYADFNKKEIDSEINQQLFQTVRNFIDTKKKSSFEEEFLESLVNETCIKPDKTGIGTYKITGIPDNIVYAKGVVLDLDCKQKPKTIENNKYYEMQEQVLFNGAWYEKCDIVKGSVSNSVYGKIKEIKSEEIIFNSVNSSVYSTFENTYSLLGNNLLISTKRKLETFCYYYIKDDNLNKIDCCNNITLNYPEKIQRYIIDKVVEKLATISEQNQNKINNLVTLNK